MASDDTVLNIDGMIPHASQHDCLVEGTDNEYGVMTLCNVIYDFRSVIEVRKTEDANVLVPS